MVDSSKLIIALALIVAHEGLALAIDVGAKVGGVKVKDCKDKPTWTPDLGKKVLTVFYTDPDEKEMNEPFRDMLKAANLDKERYRAYGVVNMKDTWAPNWAIRNAVEEKIKKFNSLILTDPDYTLRDKWRLGDCNDMDVVLVIGLDKRVKYIKKGKMSVEEQQKALKLVQELIAPSSPPAEPAKAEAKPAKAP